MLELQIHKSAFDLMEFIFRSKALDTTLALALHFDKSPFVQKGLAIEYY